MIMTWSGAASSSPASAACAMHAPVTASQQASAIISVIAAPASTQQTPNPAACTTRGHYDSEISALSGSLCAGPKAIVRPQPSRRRTLPRWAAIIAARPPPPQPQSLAMPLPAISVAAGVRTVSATAGRRPIRPVFPRAKAFLSHPVALPPAAGAPPRPRPSKRTRAHRTCASFLNTAYTLPRCLSPRLRFFASSMRACTVTCVLWYQRQRNPQRKSGGVAALAFAVPKALARRGAIASPSEGTHTAGSQQLLHICRTFAVFSQVLWQRVHWFRHVPLFWGPLILCELNMLLCADPSAAGSTYRRGSGRGPACKAAQNSGSGVSSHPLAAEQGEDALPPCCRGKSEEVAEGEAVESVAVAPTVSEPPPARSKAVASAAAPAAAPSGSSYDTSQGLSMIGVGLAGLAVVGGIVYYGRKFLTTQVPEMQKVRCSTWG